MLKRILPWGGLLATVGIALMFAALNARQRVTVDFGFFTLYSVPLSFVAFGALITGMSIVLLAGVRADLRVRELLRQKAFADLPPRPAFDSRHPTLPPLPVPEPPEDREVSQEFNGEGVRSLEDRDADGGNSLDGTGSTEDGPDLEGPTPIPDSWEAPPS